MLYRQAKLEKQQYRKIFTFPLDGKINGQASHVSTGFQ
jgi:hypothetical protein